MYKHKSIIQSADYVLYIYIDTRIYYLIYYIIESI